MRTLFISPPGIAMPSAGLCSTDVTISNVALVIRQRVDGSQCGLLHKHRRWKITTETNLANFVPVPLRCCGLFAWVVRVLGLKYAVRWFLEAIPPIR